MCLCNNAAEQRFRETNFGRQLRDSGAVRFYQRTGRDVPIYFPTNPNAWEPELGFMGYRYGMDYAPITPDYRQPGYGGVLPLTEQPKISMEQPYRKPVTF